MMYAPPAGMIEPYDMPQVPGDLCARGAKMISGFSSRRSWQGNWSRAMQSRNAGT